MVAGISGNTGVARKRPTRWWIVPPLEHLGRAPSEKPTHNDFLESARQMFNVSLGEPSYPRNGDTRVYCVCVGQVVIGVYEKVRQYSQRIAEAHHFAELALEKSA